MTSGPGKTYTLATKSSSASLVRPQIASSAVMAKGNLALRAPVMPTWPSPSRIRVCLAAALFAAPG